MIPATETSMPGNAGNAVTMLIFQIKRINLIKTRFHYVVPFLLHAKNLDRSDNTKWRKKERLTNEPLSTCTLILTEFVSQ